MQANPLKILLVDDEKNIRSTLAASLESWGHSVVAAATFDEAQKQLQSAAFDLLLTDFRLDRESGIVLIRNALRAQAGIVGVLMTAYSSFENAVNAIKEGAYDYLPKPFSMAQLEHLLKRINEVVLLKQENERLRARDTNLEYFSGQTSPAMVRLEEFVRKVASTNSSILLIGESGTGKTELARYIHRISPRAGKSFGIVNCATLSENLIESELFGHVKGAFTGAIQNHIGKLEANNFGTVLIDEIGELSPNSQAKLLQFLQDKEIEKVGDTKVQRLDVRVIAATNRNLEEAVRDKKFREDLYFRLNTFECNIVPLRFRREDLPVLIQKFYREALSKSASADQAKPISAAVLDALKNYAWPGNIRELRNVLDRIVVLSQDREMQLDDLPNSMREPLAPLRGEGAATPLVNLEALEREHIERVLKVESNQERAAAILGITTVTLWRKRKQYGLA